MWYYFAFLLLVGRSFSHSLPYFFMLLDIHVLILCIAPDGLVVKGKAEAKRERMSSKKWERERASEWCVVDIRTHVCITKKKRLLLYSFVFLPFSCSLLFFWHFSSVFLPFSCSTPRRPYRYSSILEPQCFLSVSCLLHCLVCVSDGRGETERARRWGGYRIMRNAYVYVRALIDYIFYLSMTMMRTWKTRARAPLLPVYFESTRRFFLVPLSPVPV
jgi:hypothetical protein